MSNADELGRELAALTEQAVEHLRWLRECGTEGLPPQLAPNRPVARADTFGRDTDRASTTASESAPRSSTESLTAAERASKLDELAAQVRTCTKCPLHEHRTQTVFARGNPQAELVFVGEGPGMDEDAQGLPFVGPAGQLLDRMIGAMGYERDEVYICNVVKCRPPRNRKPEPDEMAACLPYLRQQLELVQPKVLIALGATGAEGLLDWRYRDGRGIGITGLRGKWKLYAGRVPLMPTFHPSYLLRSPHKKRDVWNDLKQVMKQLGKPLPAKKPTAGSP